MHSLSNLWRMLCWSPWCFYYTPRGLTPNDLEKDVKVADRAIKAVEATRDYRVMVASRDGKHTGPMLFYEAN